MTYSLLCQFDQVSVYAARLDLPARRLAALAALLSDDEQVRVARLPVDVARRFIAARGMLRELLGTTLDLDPAALQFAYGSHGKPALTQIPDLRFNLSHSGDFALYALAWRHEVGIDLEAVYTVPNANQIVARFFAPEEQAVLAALPAQAYHEGFLRCWVRKEAYVKAAGKGLQQPLSSFAVLPRPNEPALLEVRGGSLAVHAARDLNPAPNVVAALVVGEE